MGRDWWLPVTELDVSLPCICRVEREIHTPLFQWSCFISVLATRMLVQPVDLLLDKPEHPVLEMYLECNPGLQVDMPRV